MFNTEYTNDIIECQIMARRYHIAMVKARDAGEHYAAVRYQREGCYWAEDARYLMGLKNTIE